MFMPTNSVIDIHFSKIENAKCNKSILSLNGRNKVFINLPKVTCPIGITKYKLNGVDRYSVNLSLNLDNINEKNIFNYINNLETWVDGNFYENDIWLNELNITDIETPISNIKECKSNSLLSFRKKFPPYINLKLSYDNSNNFYSEIVLKDGDDFKRIINTNDIEQLLYNKCYARAKILVSNVWFLNGKYGITLKVKKIVFHRK